MAATTHSNLPPELARTIDKSYGRRVPPYRAQDRHGRECRSGGVHALVLENEVFKATVFPGLDDRLWSLFHKSL